LRENLTHKEAFEYYFLLGVDDPTERTLKKVAQKYNKSIATIKHWSQTFNWKERVANRELAISKRVSQKNDLKVEAIKEKNLKILSATKVKFIENLKNGMVSPERVADLERIIKLELLLLGEATERIENLDFEKAQAKIDEILGLTNT